MIKDTIHTGFIERHFGNGYIALGARKILFCIFSFVFVSCITLERAPEEYYKAGLVDFCKTITNHPDSLKFLQTTFKKFYNKEYLLSCYYDSLAIDSTIKEIKQHISQYNEEVNIANYNPKMSDIRDMLNKYKVNYRFNNSNMKGIYVEKYKSRKNLIFLFIKPDNSENYYLFDIIPHNIPEKGYKDYWFDCITRD